MPLWKTPSRQYNHYLHNKTQQNNHVHGSNVADALNSGTTQNIAYTYHVYCKGTIQVEFDVMWENNENTDRTMRVYMSLHKKGDNVNTWNVVNNQPVDIIKNTPHKHFHVEVIASLDVGNGDNFTVLLNRNNAAGQQLNVVGVDINWIKISSV